MGFVPWQVLEGYNVYALDGNHLQESDKRLKPLRLLHDAPLAGTTVATFDLQRQLFDRTSKGLADAAGGTSADRYCG